MNLRAIRSLGTPPQFRLTYIVGFGSLLYKLCTTPPPPPLKVADWSTGFWINRVENMLYLECHCLLSQIFMTYQAVPKNSLITRGTSRGHFFKKTLREGYN